MRTEVADSTYVRALSGKQGVTLATSHAGVRIHAVFFARDRHQIRSRWRRERSLPSQKSHCLGRWETSYGLKLSAHTER